MRTSTTDIFSMLAFSKNATTGDTDYIVRAEISTRPWLYNDAEGTATDVP